MPNYRICRDGKRVIRNPRKHYGIGGALHFINAPYKSGDRTTRSAIILSFRSNSNLQRRETSFGKRPYVNASRPPAINCSSGQSTCFGMFLLVCPYPLFRPSLPSTAAMAALFVFCFYNDLLYFFIILIALFAIFAGSCWSSSLCSCVIWSI